VLGLDRLFHLEEQLRLRPDLVDGDDARARAFVVRIGERAAVTGGRLDEHVVAALGELTRARGRQCDAVLVRLDLLRDTDAQDARTLAAGAPAQEEQEPRKRL